MRREAIARIEAALDHTLLKPEMTATDLEDFCADALDSAVATVCIPPAWVPQAVQHVRNLKPICTVIGFPNGYQSTRTKCTEAAEALENGATELDVVVHIGHIRSGRYEAMHNEFLALRALDETAILKVILETGALTQEEIAQTVSHLNDTGVNYYKTSTGFNFPGASLVAVECIRSYKRPDIKIKASGGIRDLETALAYLDAGVTRIGASGLLNLCRRAKEEENGSNHL